MALVTGRRAGRLEGGQLQIPDELRQPRPAEHLGQVWLAQGDRIGILSPKRSVTTEQKRANGSGACGSSHAERMAYQCGEVKWLNVTIGASPRSRQPATTAS